MNEFTEEITVHRHELNAEIAVRRTYEKGIVYASTLPIPLNDVALLSGELARFTRGEAVRTVHLSDSTIELFTLDRSSMVNLEVKRVQDHPLGAYDTLSLSAEGAQRLIEQLRAQ